MAITKSTIQWIRSLERKKERDSQGVFLAEGPKICLELLRQSKCVHLFVTSTDLLPASHPGEWPVQMISLSELERMSLQKTPQGMLGVFMKPSEEEAVDTKSNLVLALDGVQDPGNVGTIIRLADWFGVKDLVLSPQCADVYSPKVVQATMGAIARIRFHVMPLEPFLENLPEDCPIYTTELEGKSIYNEPLSTNGVIVMGNEGKGVSPRVRALSKRRLLIPSYPALATTSESLNVSIATAVILSEFRRRQH